MKKTITLFSLILILISFNGYARDLRECAPVTKKMGQACDGSRHGMKLTINNQCGTKIRANVCFETLDGRWDCDSDTIYADENGELAYMFSNCNTTGQYKLELCQTVNGKLDCGSKPKLQTPYAKLTCSTGKTVEYSIKPYLNGLFRLKMKSGEYATIKINKDRKKGTYYISVNDISMVLCREPVKDSMGRKLMNSVRDRLITTEAEWKEECAEEHHPDWCSNQYMRRFRNKVRTKTPGLGVRG